MYCFVITTFIVFDLIILQHIVPTCFSATLICCGMLPASEEVFEEEEVRENPSSPRRKLLWLRRRLSSLQDLQITYRSVNGGAIYRLKKLTEIFKRHYLEESQRQPNTHRTIWYNFPCVLQPLEISHVSNGTHNSSKNLKFMLVKMTQQKFIIPRKKYPQIIFSYQETLDFYQQIYWVRLKMRGNKKNFCFLIPKIL